MIYLTFINFSAFHHFQKDGESLEFLGKQEKVEYARLKVPKRKEEWMGSRLAVKRLIFACRPQLGLANLAQVQILKEHSGVPFLQINEAGRLLGWLSLSHSHGHVLAAYSPDDIRFGVDLELIEYRSIDFVRDFFTTAEVQQATIGAPDQKIVATTIIWSAKGVVLKAISEGLRIDTRKIEIHFSPETSNGARWNRLDITSADVKIPSQRLLWRKEGDFIQTLCILESPDQELKWVSF